MIDAVLMDDPELPRRLIYHFGRTRVYQINVPEALVVRIIEDDSSSYQFQVALLDEAAGQDELTTRILYWETRVTSNGALGVQVQTFIPGEAVKSYPEYWQTKAVIQAVYNLQERLCTASNKMETGFIPNIDDIIKQRYAQVDDCPIKTSAGKLLEHERYIKLVSQPGQCLIHGDLWYRNIHLDGSGNKMKARFIDFEPIITGPAILQPATLFSSYFLLSAVLFEPDGMNSFNLDELLSFWPAPLTKDDVLVMMSVFPVALGLLKQYRFSRAENADREMHRVDMEPLEKCVQVIDRMMRNP